MSVSYFSVGVAKYLVKQLEGGRVYSGSQFKGYTVYHGGEGLTAFEAAGVNCVHS